MHVSNVFFSSCPTMTLLDLLGSLGCYDSENKSVFCSLNLRMFKNELLQFMKLFVLKASPLYFMSETW